MDWHPVISVQQQTPDNDFCHFTVSNVHFAFWAFFENRKKIGSHNGSKWWPGDPVTRTWKMTQMTHWPGDPMTQFHVCRIPDEGSGPLWRFAAVGPANRRCRSIAAAAKRCRSTAFSSKCEQCHAVSWRRRLNTGLRLLCRLVLLCSQSATILVASLL